MNNKHTPGPWTAFHYRKYAEWHVSTPTEDGVMRLGLFPDGVPTGESAEADAKLIAAAPELLEACQTFSEWLRREDAGFIKAGNERDTPEGEAAWREWYSENLRICDLAQKQAHAAIAKATGNN